MALRLSMAWKRSVSFFFAALTDAVRLAETFLWSFATAASKLAICAQSKRSSVPK